MKRKKKLAHLPVHSCRIRAPGRSRRQPPLRWARKLRTDSNRLALVVAVVSVRLSRRPAARTQSTTSPWRSCRRRRVTTTGPIIVADDISGTDRARVATDVSGRYKTRVSSVRRISRFNFAIERATSRESITILDRTRESHIGSAHFTFRENSGSRERERDECDGCWRMKSCHGDEDETHSAPRVSLVVVVVVSETAVRGWSYPATQRRGKPQVIASVHSRHARKVGRTRWEFLRARCVILIVTEGREGKDSSFFLHLDARPADLHHNVSPWAWTRMFANFLPLHLLRAHLLQIFSLSLVSRTRERGRKRQKLACYLITEFFVRKTMAYGDAIVLQIAECVIAAYLFI